jgi:hypothetical protein
MPPPNPQSPDAHYTIEITPASSSGAEISIAVEISDAHLRVIEVKVLPRGEESVLPTELALLDLKQCLDIARMLMAGCPRPPTTFAAPVDDGAGQSNERDGVDSAARVNGSSLVNARKQLSDRSVGSGAPSDVGLVYWRLGSVPKLAKHYDVPVQVARDWVKELRAGRRTGRSSSRP